MKINNIKGLSPEMIEVEVHKGGRFKYFAYTISIIVFTWHSSSEVYFIKNGENAVAKGMPFTILSFLFGCWGFPKGPKHTFQSIRTNLNGGKDVTEEVMSTVAGHLLYKEAQQLKRAQQNNKENTKQGLTATG